MTTYAIADADDLLVTIDADDLIEALDWAVATLDGLHDDEAEDLGTTREHTDALQTRLVRVLSVLSANQSEENPPA